MQENKVNIITYFKSKVKNKVKCNIMCRTMCQRVKVGVQGVKLDPTSYPMQSNGAIIILKEINQLRLSGEFKLNLKAI